MGRQGAAWVHSTNLTLEFRPDRWPTVIPRLFTSDAVGLVNFLRATFHAHGELRRRAGSRRFRLGPPADIAR